MSKEARILPIGARPASKMGKAAPDARIQARTECKTSNTGAVIRPITGKGIAKSAPAKAIHIKTSMIGAAAVAAKIPAGIKVPKVKSDTGAVPHTAAKDAENALASKSGIQCLRIIKNRPLNAISPAIALKE